ncbi:MAG: PASTA domain-containing protein, partial [Clostridiales bacterium]
QLIKKGRKIELTISQGPKEIPMPGLIGKTRREAETILQNNSLTVDLKEEYDSKVPAGQVISQYPVQGEMAAENSQVQLVVSKGSKPVYITMSNYLGSTLNDARVSLESKGLFVGKTKYEPSNEYYQGIVLGQSVKEGQDVREGESIDLTVSDGPGPVGKMATVNYTVPNDGLEHTVRIVVADTSGTHEEYNAKLVPGSEISPNVTFYNKGKITIYLDGEAVYSKDVT